ncbi:DUF2249 domain-containing protein [Alkalimarinus alittae]|uniref:DUF2249 domain-containing protein n=1 Tax=Alkalimarinus alittae TaxID=2961619 RepID=A0ABY6N458_9ALTE|nr:DUF2249 domain-containing protein [Alkalimarinus alittae]UZE96869.1 DUF2249 domain-containing protein [Alkalimarinus alittae]
MIHLDVSDLEPPEPYSLAVDILMALPSDAIFKMTHRQEPFPLYQTAAEMGFDHYTTYPAENVVKIQFWHKDNIEAAARFLTDSTPD